MNDRYGMRRSPPRRRVWLALGATLGLAALSAAPARGYEYYGLGWDPELWPPAETMVVTLVDSELWLERGFYSGIGEVRAVLQRALDVWAAIPTADIRWEIGEIISQEAWDAIPSIDDRPLIAVVPVSVRAPLWQTGAARGFVKVDGVWLTQSCHISVSRRDPPWLFVEAVHEFGHCLGSAHPEPYTLSYGWLDHDFYPVYWRSDPVMSYGRWQRGFDTRLTADDEIGASLARPAPGWLETTGTILARVTLPDGTEVPWAYVLATRLLEPASASYSVGRSTAWHGPGGERVVPPGVADIRGLPPGDYWLLVRSPTGLGHGRILHDLRSGAVLDLRQTLRAGPVRVRAGEEVRVSLAVRRVGRLP